MGVSVLCKIQIKGRPVALGYPNLKITCRDTGFAREENLVNGIYLELVLIQTVIVGAMSLRAVAQGPMVRRCSGQGHHLDGQIPRKVNPGPLLEVAVGVGNIKACHSMEFGHDHYILLLFPCSLIPCRQMLQEPHHDLPFSEEIPHLRQNFLRWYLSNEHYLYYIIYLIYIYILYLYITITYYNYFVRQQGNKGCVP